LTPAGLTQPKLLRCSLVAHIVRPASILDVPVLVDIGERFYPLSPFHSLGPYDHEAVARTLEVLLQADNTRVFVSDRDGQVTGTIAGCLVPLFPCPSVQFVQELFWYVNKDSRVSGDGLQLYVALENWARQHGAKALVMHRLAGGPDLSPLYDRLGFSLNEVSHVKVL
jgi:hypothetical protein